MWGWGLGCAGDGLVWRQRGNGAALEVLVSPLPRSCAVPSCLRTALAMEQWVWVTRDQMHIPYSKQVLLNGTLLFVDEVHKVDDLPAEVVFILLPLLDCVPR